ncbi:MAG: hypothetical protein IJQ21_05930, partial [Lachnospiraceae bacterium]|nr:hypothetical protein [Lachnospiraceae bacterium]
METGSKRGGNKGLIIGLIAVVVVLFAVAVVMGVKLFGGGESDTGADASTKKTRERRPSKEASTEMTEEKPEEQVDIEQVLAAYAKTLRETEESEYLESYATFGMGYVDDDDVPELFVAEADYHACGIRIYSYKNGEVIDHGYFGEYGGGMSYLPREGLISSYYVGMGAASLYRYRLENGECTHLARLVEEEVYVEAIDDYDIVYYINDMVVSKEEYDREANVYAERRDNFVAPGIGDMTLFSETDDYVDALRPYLDEDYLIRAIKENRERYAGGGETIVVGDYYGYRITLPEEWAGKVEYTTELANNEGGYALDTDVTFYLKEEREAANGNGGMLFTLSILAKPWELPTRYDILGSLIMDGYCTYYLCAIYPGDVQFSTEEARREAQAFYDATDAFFDTVDFGSAATWFYSPADRDHRQEELYNGIRYDYLLTANEQTDEAGLKEMGLSTCYFDMAGTEIEEEYMQCAITDLNDDGTFELLLLYNYEVRAIHSIGEDGVPVLVYTCPYRSEMKIMEDNTIRVTSSVDGSVRVYRLTADLSGLVDAGSSQTEEEAVLYPFDMSPAAYRGFDGDSSGDYAFGSKGIQVFGGWYENIYAGVTVNIWDQMTGIEFAFSE